MSKSREFRVYSPGDRPDVEVGVDGDSYPREVRSESTSPTGLWAKCSWFLKLGELVRTLLGPFHEDDMRPDTIDRSYGRSNKKSHLTC